MKFKIFIVSILFTVLSVSISKADLASIPPEKKLEIAQQFLENVKTFVKLYPDEFDTIKIFEFILATRPIVEGTLDDKLKEDLAIAYMWISNSLMEHYRINSKSGLTDSHRKKEYMLSNDKNLLNDDRMVNEAINQLDDLYASMPSSDLIKGISLGNSCWKSKFKNCDK